MKAVIVGGGILGLATAFFLHKKHPHAHITIVEKTKRLGGWVRTIEQDGFIFEQGPRTFSIAKSPHLLSLAKELGLEILYSDPSCAERFLLHKGRLCSLRSFVPRFLFSAARELFVAPATVLDESIYDFATRRFGARAAEQLFDPMTLGIYAGDMRKLSIRACFPSLFRFERESKSVVRGSFREPKKARGLFTFKRGVESLVHALEQRLPIQVLYNTTECPRDADIVLTAVPMDIPHQSLWVVNLGFAGSFVPKKGYGYLVPSKEKEALLGMVFDSAIFPTQNGPHKTVLTAMVRAEAAHPLETALAAVEKHLHIKAKPIHSHVFFAKNAIPQFEVGCTYFEDVSVEGRIQKAQSIVQQAT